MSQSRRRWGNARGALAATLLAVALGNVALPLEHAMANPSRDARASWQKPTARTCGCAHPRLLRSGKEVFLDETGGLAAWLDERSRLEVFEQDPDTAELRSIAPALRTDAFEPAFEGARIETRARLVKVVPTELVPEPFFISLLRAPAKAPADVVRARVMAAVPAGEVSPKGPPALLAALHIGPLEQRDSPGCGGYATHRVVFSVPAGGIEPAGLLVSATPLVEGGRGPTRATLLDTRHARTFGLGRAEVCGQGMPFAPGEKVEIEVRTVSPTFALGPRWRFMSDGGRTGEPPRLLEVPAHADLDAVENPFAPGYRTPLERLLSDDTDHATFGGMVGLMTLAAMGAGLWWGARRRRRRQLVEVKCPSCGKGLSLDLNDPETDGMFCPSCGGASVFVTYGPDGTPRARVLRLEG